MIPASIVFVLLAVGSIGAQAGQFGAELGGHIEGHFDYGECAASEFDGPLGRTIPDSYGFMMSVGEAKQPGQSALLLITVKFDESQGKEEEPKNVVVLHLDSSVKVDTLTVLKERTAWPFIKLPLPIESVCQDSAKQLLVIKFEDEIVDKSVIEMLFTTKSAIREDNKGIHREGDVIKGSFANQQARLSMPCFDDDKYKTTIDSSIYTDPAYVASTETLKIESQDVVLGKHRLVMFEKMTSSSLSEFSFQLKPDTE